MAAMSMKGEKEEIENVHRVTQKGGKHMKPRGKHMDKEEGKTESKCYRCGYTDHMGKDPKCPARGQTCHKCNGKDHFSKMCRTKGSKEQKVNIAEEEERAYAFSVKEEAMSERLTFYVGGVDLEMVVDSGAKSNVMGENVWERLKAEEIKCHSSAKGMEKFTPILIQGATAN